MRSNSYLIMLGFSLVGSFLTAFAYSVSASGKIQLDTIFLPGVIQVALIFAFVCGIILSPLMYWCLRDKNLTVYLPAIYAVIFVLTIFLNYIDQRLSFLGAFFIWAILLLLIKYYFPSFNHGSMGAP